MAIKATKYTSIPKTVKEAVWSRDGGRCVICGNFNSGPHCHYIPRSKGGLGIEENIWTGCNDCHRIFDQGIAADREPLKRTVKAHLMRHYPNWDENKLVYRKGDMTK